MGPLEIIQANPMSKQGHQIQVGLECLHRGKIQELPGQFQCSVTLNKKKLFLVLRWNFLLFQFMAIAPHPVTGHHKKSLT